MIRNEWYLSRSVMTNLQDYRVCLVSKRPRVVNDSRWMGSWHFPDTIMSFVVDRPWFV